MIGGRSIDAAASPVSDMPSLSVEFRRELGALLAYYAARIAAARLTMPPSAAAAIVGRLMDEQTIGLRNIVERWHEASKSRQGQNPIKPTLNSNQRDGDPKPL